MSRQEIEHFLACAAGVLIVIALIAGLIWVASEIPCSWYRFAKAGEVPARCFINFKH